MPHNSETRYANDLEDYRQYALIYEGGLQPKVNQYCGQVGNSKTVFAIDDIVGRDTLRGEAENCLIKEVTLYQMRSDESGEIVEVSSYPAKVQLRVLLEEKTSSLCFKWSLTRESHNVLTRVPVLDMDRLTEAFSKSAKMLGNAKSCPVSLGAPAAMARLGFSSPVKDEVVQTPPGLSMRAA